MTDRNSAPAMVNAWRRRRMCIVRTDRPFPVALRSISGNGAFLETNVRPPMNSAVEFLHPEAGAISARVSSFTQDGIGIAFAADSQSVAFALAAITADMTQG